MIQRKQAKIWTMLEYKQSQYKFSNVVNPSSLIISAMLEIFFLGVELDNSDVI